MKRTSVAAGPRIGSASAPSAGRRRRARRCPRWPRARPPWSPARAGRCPRRSPGRGRGRWRCAPPPAWRCRRCRPGLRRPRARSTGLASGWTGRRGRAGAGRDAAEHGADRARSGRARPGSRSIVPATGAGTSASTLSVEISTSTSSTATCRRAAPATRAPCPRRPSRPSPGRSRRRSRHRSSVSGGASSVSGGRRLGRLGSRRPRRSRSRRATSPTCTVSSGSTRILRQRAGGRRGHLGVDLVGGDLDQRLVGLHRVAHLLQPLEHGALGDRLAHLGHRDLDGRRPRGHPALTVPRRVQGKARASWRARATPP